MGSSKIDNFLSVLQSVEISVVLSGTKSMENETIQRLVSCDSELIQTSLVKFADICDCILTGQYCKILNIDILNSILECAQFSSDSISFNFSLRDDIPTGELCFVTDYMLLFFGISALQEFIRRNWTGPYQDKDDLPVLNQFFSSSERHKFMSDTLSDCGVSTYNQVKEPKLLVLCKYLLNAINNDSIKTKNWWLLRCTMIHQLILLEKSGKLYNEMKILIDLNNKELHEYDKKVNLLLNIECGLIHLYYNEIMSSKKYFTCARELTDLDFELSGAFAKRTQFQIKAVAQLLVKLKHNSIERVECEYKKDFPKDIKLEDEVLLSKTEFINSDDNNSQILFPEEQLVMLSECCLVQKSDASDELLNEKLMAYINCLLSQPTVWSIQMKALLMRSKLEKQRSRTVERSMKQIESLLKELSAETPDFMTRQKMFYSVLFPPYWAIEKELADLLISLGAVKSALDIYLRLQLWEEIVNCYKILEQNEKAAEIVRRKIEENETPLLWCILGDVTDDIDCYGKAWELSNHRNARSQSCLGYFYYKKQDYKTAVSYFETSLKLNHLQPNVWFSLAFAATQIQNYELASKAYRHVVEMDSDNFQAWNNLSNAYIHLKQKDRAYRTLQEALKCNFDNWRIWENYLLVCMDIGAFEDAIHAYHRLLDLKGKHEDVEVLTILTRAVCTDMKDLNGHSSFRLKPKLTELFGRLTSTIPNNCDIWKQYSFLYLTDEGATNNKELMERVVNFQQKGHKFAIQKPNWEKDYVTCRNIVLNAIELGKNYCLYLGLLDGTVKNQVKSSAKLMLRNLLTRVENKLKDFSAANIDELEQDLITLKDTLANVEIM